MFPQMSPINWLILLIMFLMMIFILINMNYYMFNYKNSKPMLYPYLIKNNWKW